MFGNLLKQTWFQTAIGIAAATVIIVPLAMWGMKKLNVSLPSA